MDLNMSVPVMNGAPPMVVTHFQPVTVAVPETANQAFRKGYPLALGTTQIMIGVFVLLSGIIMAISVPNMGVYSGIFVWGALLYITAGSLTVAAGRYDSRCLVNGSMGVSITCVIISLAASAMYGLDTAGVLYHCRDGCHSCYIALVLSQGFSGIMLLLNILMLAVSITVSGFGCNAICSCCAEPPRAMNHVMIPQVPQVPPKVSSDELPAYYKMPADRHIN